MHQVLAKYLASGINQDFTDKVSEVYTYLVDCCDMSSIYIMFTRNIAVMFPNVVSLSFRFEYRCEIVSFLLTMITKN